MHIGGFLASFLLHAALLLLIWFWPEPSPIDLGQGTIIEISVVEGAPGGESLPSPVLGPRPSAPGNLMPAPAPAAPAAPTTAEAPQAPALPTNVPPPPSPAAVPQPTPTPPPPPQPIPVPDPVAVPIAPEIPKPQPKPQPQPTPEPQPKPQPKPQPQPTPQPKPQPAPSRPNTPQVSAVERALQGSATGQNRPASGQQGGSAVDRAMNDIRASGGGRGGAGGGGGTGDGPGGGGLDAVYAGQIAMVVKPNWQLPVFSRQNLVVRVRIKMDRTGKILDCTVEESSGKPEIDASAVNAVLRTGTLPPPPNPSFMDIVVGFNSQEAVGAR